MIKAVRRKRIVTEYDRISIVAMRNNNILKLEIVELHLYFNYKRDRDEEINYSGA